MSEKRLFPRKKKRLLVDFEVGGRKQTGFTWDVSYTGLFISSMHTPRIGDELVVNLHLPSLKVVVCPGRVVRIRRVPSGLAQSGGNGFCLSISGYVEEYCRFVEAV